MGFVFIGIFAKDIAQRFAKKKYKATQSKKSFFVHLSVFSLCIFAKQKNI
jgi:hypothetical protein